MINTDNKSTYTETVNGETVMLSTKDELLNRIYKYAPETDKDAWNMYPKYNWIYETTRILDFQKVKWKPFNDKDAYVSLQPFSIDTKYNSLAIFNTGETNRNIFINDQYFSEGFQLTTMVIHKGQPVHQVHYKSDYTLVKEIPGELELKVLGLLSWHFEKYCGLITFAYTDKMIFQISLAVDRNVLTNLLDESVLKKLTALYSRRQWRST